MNRMKFVHNDKKISFVIEMGRRRTKVGISQFLLLANKIQIAVKLAECTTKYFEII